MNRGRLVKIPSSRFVWLVLIAAGGLTAAKAQASVADSLCGVGAKAMSRYPSSDDLQRAAALIETRLGSADTSATRQDTLATLEVPATADARPSPAAMASYCAAAGEVMRISPAGSQLQAQSFLLSSFDFANAGQTRGVGVLAAYRLGLVWLADPGNAGTRSMGRTRGAAAEPPAAAAPLAASSCAVLGQPNMMARASRFVSATALECASAQGRATNMPKLAALADLRLARMAIALADDGVDVARLRARALEKARGALVAGAMVPDLATRTDVSGRALWIMLDLDASGDPAVAPALAAIQGAAGDDPGVRALALALSARVALARGNRAAAIASLERAIFYESQRAQPLRLSDWYLLLGEADPAQRPRHVLAAYRALESVRSILPRVDPLTEEPNFALRMRRVFESAVDVQLAAAGGADDALRISRAQEIIEAYRQAELQSVFGSECVPARDPIKPGELKPGEILLYPILLPDRVELIYADGNDAAREGGIRYRRLAPDQAANRQTVARLVEEMVLAINRGSEWQPPARRLHEILIRPIEAKLSERTTLVIVPDGPLRALPFAALRDEKGGYLVQRTRLTVVPALSYAQPGTPRDDDPPIIVAASLEREVNLPSGYFAELVGTGEEARIAAGADAATHGTNRLITNFQAADLTRALSAGPVDVLHLATHATFNGRSDRAFIVANGETIPLSALRRLISENRARGDDLDLLVLSACETALGDDEASMGLAGAAVQAGARSAIASLWEINDAGTVSLMKEFYAAYRSGKSKSDALRDAQLALIARGGDDADPFIWAAFTFLGSWR